MKFELGQTVMTKGIADAIEENGLFALEVQNAFVKYVSCDWGDMCEEDKEMNDVAVKNNDERIVAAYHTSIKKIYIITEWDRSVTTILFADEY